MSTTRNRTTLATVDHKSVTKPPILTPGELSPQILQDWKFACTSYFRHKEIKATDQVEMVVSGMEDPVIRAWYQGNPATLHALTFDAYMKEMAKVWLPKNWELKVRRSVNGEHQGERDFWSWATHIRQTNATLLGTTYHANDTRLMEILEANMDPHLSKAVERKGIIATNIKDWLEEIRTVDDERQDVREQVASAVAAERSRNRADRDARRATNTTQYVPRSAAVATPSTSAAATSEARLPRLTESERELLNKYHGCRKCRRFWVYHQTQNCPNGFASGVGYAPLTEAQALASKPRSTSAPVKAEPIAVLGTGSAALGNGTSSEDESDSD
ncbi:uncharacterized protein STEHIDRAFT_82131 [Stereum hirsutum FP-91666 SS1]|uniref:uncharacterized protein n=1 Tax=Stereum hirsutum (strain FP-91666) TaxID=721885 RepID=UPI0004449976|nr:uncharacterized protein STEHIDRAFT_82131 [Stereum hirsutum FP-91666 SS1]EIM84247.1 hypothetical protein STEHIDRAFT_82131 [Stereum hirsutum FP-91666 SS1]